MTKKKFSHVNNHMVMDISTDPLKSIDLLFGNSGFSI